MAAEKTRISVTLTKAYLDRVSHLMLEGIYLDRVSVIMAGLRLLFKSHGIPLSHPEDEV